MDKLFEVCCQSYEDAKICKESGADQIELNSGLFLGGLTPSLGLLRRIKKDIDIPVMAMVRPRAGGFNYSIEEYKTILEDVDLLLDEDVEGIVFGCLRDDCSLDIEKNKEIIKKIHNKGKIAVFHRAFDQLLDPIDGIEKLISLGLDRVLTSGQEPLAVDGIELLGKLERDYGEKIEILVGSGVNRDSIKEIYSKTSIKRYHGSCRGFFQDKTTVGNVSYGYLDGINENSYEITDESMVRELVDILDNL